MKASELISILEAHIKEHGDLDVQLYSDDGSGYDEVSGVNLKIDNRDEDKSLTFLID